MDETSLSGLRDELLDSLRIIYQLPAFGALAELLQGEALVLQYLSVCGDEPTYPSQLSDRLHLSRSRITGALNSLRRKEFVRLEPSPGDRRRVEVFITPAGREQIEGQMQRMLAYFDRMLNGLGTQDAESLIALMNRCIAIMEE